jgi:hypothetical protein
MYPAVLIFDVNEPEFIVPGTKVISVAPIWPFFSSPLHMSRTSINPEGFNYIFCNITYNEQKQTLHAFQMLFSQSWFFSIRSNVANPDRDSFDDAQRDRNPHHLSSLKHNLVP